MKREDLDGFTVDEIWATVVEKHGIRKANILVAEAAYKMIKKQLNLDVTLEIQREASIRVLAGQQGAIDIPIKEGLL